jgi:apolipoprotein N-acyltransferase
VLDTPVGRLGVAISWEIFFADRTRDATAHGGIVLLNPTNGASFSGTAVQSQQIAASRLRAIETGRWVLQVAPTGYSAFVTATGEVVAQTDIGEATVLSDRAELRDGQTIATRVGDWLALALAAAAVGGGWWWERRRRSQLQEDGDGTVVDQLDVHVGAEPPGGDRRPELP